MPAGTVRRNVALSADLISKVASVSPPELRRNLNRLVRVAIEEYVARREQLEFEAALLAMSRDPNIQREMRRIDREFRATESDGLRR